jgi:hypothetical protein
MVADQLERYYATFNIPSHSDLVALGERMKAIEESLARLEATVAANGTTAKRGSAQRAPARPKPARTKKPAGARPASKTNGTSAS